MMRKINLLLGIWLAALTVVQGQSATREFDLRNFEKLSLGSAFVINVKPGLDYRVVATGEEADLDVLVARVSGKTLHVNFERGSRTHDRVTIDIQMPILLGINLSGASSMNVERFEVSADFRLSVSGASKLVMEIDAPFIDADLSGASRVVVKGRAQNLRGALSGASKLEASGLATQSADIAASGASSATVRASERLDINASGASVIRYSGTAKDIRSKTSGGSSVRKAG